MAAPKDKKPVMDVSKPGKTPADATARPIISGHEIMKDPMVNDEPAKMEGVTVDVKTSDEPQETVAVPPTSHKIIQPLSSPEENQEETKEEPAEKPAEESDAEPTPNEDEKKETPVTEDAVVDAVLDQVGDKKEETKESEEDRKRQEQVDKLIEEKKYFVPIAQERKRRNNRLVLLVLGALLPVIVGLGVAADAGAIDLGFKVPFDFIKDKNMTTPTVQSVTPEPKKDTNPLVVIDTSAATITKDYTDTAKVYSVKYPSNWTVKLSEPAGEGTAPDFTKVSRSLDFVYPKAVDGMGVGVQADTTGDLAQTIVANWATNKHTPEKKVINGYSVQYVQVVFKGDAESYTDENYLFTKNGTSVFITFRQKYYHQSPAANWDASKAVPGFETILNSIKLLK
jgi:hypothetical protein